MKALSKIKVPDKKEVVKKSSARVFQALRIDINSEFEVLYTFLNKLPYVLAPGGRVAILTFHSGEDRLVKKSFKKNFSKKGSMQRDCGQRYASERGGVFPQRAS